MARGRGGASLVACLLLAGLAAGCVEPFEAYYAFDADAEYRNPGVFPGNYTWATPSQVLRGGLLQATAPEVVRLKSTLPAFPDVAGEENADGVVFITMAVWRPANVTGPVPVIVDAGPYYEIGFHCAAPGDDPQKGCPNSGQVPDTIDHPGQTTPFSLANFLPHGYAVAQVAVRGTGTSGGCMDLMGPAEVHDLDQAITWLGTQPWSNGNVAMMGVSYDGSTPWEVASTGNPHLKAIVPISGLPDIYDLMFHNGTAETRGAIMHNIVYWPFGFSDGWPYNTLPPVQLPDGVPVEAPEPALPVSGVANGREAYQDRQNLLCEDAAKGLAMGPYGSTAADRGSDIDPYWAERDHRQAVLDNYEGSVFLIHGLQDWNVDPHAAIPFNAQLRAKGLPMKEWYGQWDHANPDTSCPQRTPAGIVAPCRLDYAEVLLRWFDRHLKGLDVETGPAIQVQDNLGGWRNAASFPPADATWLELPLGAGTLGGDAQAGTERLDPTTAAARGNVLEFRSEPLADDLRVSGLPQLRLPFTPTGQGGDVAAWLFDEDPDGNVRAAFAFEASRGQWEVPTADMVPPVVGHAHMNLRHYAGGEEPQPLTPGQRHVARIEFEPLDIVVPRGHRVTLWLFQGTYPEHQSSATPAAVDVHTGPDAVLRLPVVAVDPKDTFPVPGIHMPDREHLSVMYTPKPPAPQRLVEPPTLVPFVRAAPAPALPGPALPAPPLPDAGLPTAGGPDHTTATVTGPAAVHAARVVA